MLQCIFLCCPLPFKCRSSIDPGRRTFLMSMSSYRCSETLAMFLLADLFQFTRRHLLIFFIILVVVRINQCISLSLLCRQVKHRFIKIAVAVVLNVLLALLYRLRRQHSMFRTISLAKSNWKVIITTLLQLGNFVLIHRYLFVRAFAELMDWLHPRRFFSGRSSQKMLVVHHYFIITKIIGHCFTVAGNKCQALHEGMVTHSARNARQQVTSVRE